MPSAPASFQSAVTVVMDFPRLRRALGRWEFWTDPLSLLFRCRSTMDRKARGIRAGALVALAALLSVGCGTDSVSTSTDLWNSPANDQAQAAVPSSAESEPESVAAEVVEVVTNPPFESDDAIEPEPVESSIVGSSTIDDAEPTEVATAPNDSEETSVAVADEPTPAVSALEPESETTQADKETGARSEIKFALPGAADPISDEPADGDAGHHGGPRHMTIKLAIRPGDAQPLETPQPEAVDEESPEIAVEEPAVVKSGLTPLVVTPREIPDTELAEEEVEQLPVTPESIAQAQPAAPAVQQPPVEQPPVEQPPAMVAHSPATMAALARAHERVRHGIQLAEKGALYAARREFTTAIKTIAQANDVEQRSRECTKATIAGFVALKEANDFADPNVGFGESEIARLVAGHKTTVLKDADVTDMPPTIAAQYYYSYAKEQLALAVGRETIGSIALYGLGKVIIAGAGPNAQQLEYAGPAMALYQAALMAEPHNFRAAHELGVLLAGTGQLELARQMLIGSVSVSSQPIIWQNLAAVHSRLGEQQLAQQARQRAEALRQTNPESKAPPVQWVDPATFAKTVPDNDTLIPKAVQSQTESTPAQASSEPTKPKTNIAKRPTGWNPLNLRR